MRYFKDKNNELHAFDSDADVKDYVEQRGLIEITSAEYSIMIEKMREEERLLALGE